MRWYRVFGTNDTQPAPAALLEHLQRQGHAVTAKFRGDDQGWFAVQIRSTTAETPVQLERFLAAEEGIRAELNSWAAWLETMEQHPQHVLLMSHMIGTRQLVTLEFPPD